MKSPNNKGLCLKTILNLTGIGLAIAFLILLFVFKGSMNTMLSEKMQQQATGELNAGVAHYIDSSFNYTRNHLSYNITFLEFGATGCVACKRMEEVMEEVRLSHSQTVRILFINVLLPGSQDLMKYYGIASIPMQVLLDSSGKEFFRHTGYLSYSELVDQFKSKR